MTEPSQHVIRKIAAVDGSISTVAGSPGQSGWTPDGPGLSSLLSSPYAMTWIPGSNSLVWTEQMSCVVRKLSLSNGWVSTVAGTPNGCGFLDGPAQSAKFGVNGLFGIAAYGNDLFISDSREWLLFLLPAHPERDP